MTSALEDQAEARQYKSDACRLFSLPVRLFCLLILKKLRSSSTGFNVYLHLLILLEVTLFIPSAFTLVSLSISFYSDQSLILFNSLTSESRSKWRFSVCHNKNGSFLLFSIYFKCCPFHVTATCFNLHIQHLTCSTIVILKYHSRNGCSKDLCI